MRIVTNTHDLGGDRDHASRWVLPLQAVNRTQIAVVGGKGANLGELAQLESIRVPAGFCVTTQAFRRAMADASPIDDLVEQLLRLRPDEHDMIRALSARVRRVIEETVIPGDAANAISAAVASLRRGSDGVRAVGGGELSFAVRSSATAEDLPTTSFAGQHDTFLNVSEAEILQHICRCWASLFTERAVTYRLRNGIDHRQVQMAVVVQQMVVPQASGVLFTADPVTGNRKVVTIEASFGLGEALVSGLVNADVYRVHDGEVAERSIVAERTALTDAQITQLAQLGRRIEAHFGRPQDIEWCLTDEDFHIVQSRPITTLFPIPAVDDGEKHVYLSTGHQQMMTDAMKPLGISVRQLTAAVPMYEAAGRLFVDVSRALASEAGRAGLLGMAGRSDPLMGDALQTIIDRTFIPLNPAAVPNPPPASATLAPLETDPAIAADLIARGQASNAALKREIETKSGAALLDFILTDLQELKRVLFDPRSHQAIMAGMEATWWLNDHLEEWLGEKNAADVLAQSVSDNMTSEMGLELLDVADAIRPHPAVVAFLQRVEDDEFLNELPRIAGGVEARDAIQTWLDKHGMRGVGEIDITRPRWSERPSMLVPMILSNVRNFEPGEARRRFEQGLLAAQRKEADLLERVRALPDGERKAHEVKSMIDRLRTFIGYREYPKYFIVDRYMPYKRALMREAERLVQDDVLRERDDVFYLTLQELEDVARTRDADYDLIRERKAAFNEYERLTPPRVLTSDGEMVAGSYRRGNIPVGAMVGLGVSAGAVEGRARVVFDLATADLEPGDILVTPYTDPSWTPLFVAIRGLVTEVGGLMTHGAVIAREYGLPAVVGVEHATRLISDGQWIRVNGTDGYVECDQLQRIDSVARTGR